MDLTENNLCISYKHKKKFFIQRLDHDIPMYFDALKANLMSKLLHRVTIFFLLTEHS